MLMFRKTDVGILTWHFHTNVGSNLQAYAIYKKITELGYSCRLINYRGNCGKKSIKSILKSVLKNIICKGIAVFPYAFPRKLKEKVFVFQKNFMKETLKCYKKHELKKLNKRFSMFICGSDQIWAPNVIDDVYLLSFASGNIPKCSYAASVGLCRIPDEKKELYKRYLEKFSMITVREQKAKEILSEFIDKDISVVLDPTFLIEKKQWESISMPPKETNYLFCYLLGNNELYCDWIENIAKKNGLQVICMSNTINKKYKDWIYYSYIGPQAFLGYIKNSELVITDSFHGMALSINLQKNFYILERFSSEDTINQNSRIYNIIEMFGIYDRLMVRETDVIEPIDYMGICDKLYQMREYSLLKLKEMLYFIEEKF